MVMVVMVLLNPFRVVLVTVFVVVMVVVVVVIGRPPRGRDYYSEDSTYGSGLLFVLATVCGGPIE